MSPKISVLIRKNCHEVISVITNHYKKCSKSSTLSNIPLYVAAFSTRSLKMKKLHGNSPGSRSTPARFTIDQHNIYVFTIQK
jgi:hypothetical protein